MDTPRSLLLVSCRANTVASTIITAHVSALWLPRHLQTGYSPHAVQFPVSSLLLYGFYSIHNPSMQTQLSSSQRITKLLVTLSLDPLFKIPQLYFGKSNSLWHKQQRESINSHTQGACKPRGVTGLDVTAQMVPVPPQHSLTF